MTFLKLVHRNLLRHPVRSLLTVGSLVVAMFLLCTLRSLLTTMNAGLEVASARRLIVQSAVSLFVDLPLSYQPKIEAVEGVELTCKWQWFGGYYQDRRNFFAQFAVDEERLLEIYPEMEIVEGSQEGFLRNRRGCLIGEGLARKFGWEVGDRVPIISAIFPNPSAESDAWEFEVEAIYRPSVKNFDDRLFLFHWDYFEETMAQSDTGTPGFGTVVIRTASGADPTAVMASVDALFENGPQRVQTTTEAEFQRQFISMMGSVPFFIGSIGGGVLFAILLACVNTMLMTGREQTHDFGILKSLGFADGRLFRLMVAQSMLLCVAGGGAGIALAVLSQNGIALAMGRFFPGYAVEPSTVALAAAATLAVGLVAGIFPAWRAARLEAVEALRSTG